MVHGGGKGGVVHGGGRGSLKGCAPLGKVTAFYGVARPSKPSAITHSDVLDAWDSCYLTTALTTTRRAFMRTQPLTDPVQPTVTNWSKTQYKNALEQPVFDCLVLQNAQVPVAVWHICGRVFCVPCLHALSWNTATMLAKDHSNWPRSCRDLSTCKQQPHARHVTINQNDCS